MKRTLILLMVTLPLIIPSPSRALDLSSMFKSKTPLT